VPAFFRQFGVFTDDLITRRNSGGSRSVGRLNRCVHFVIMPDDVVDPP
jgi:hypothetical protein